MAVRGDDKRNQQLCPGTALPFREKAANGRLVKNTIMPELARAGESTRGRARRSLPESNLAAGI
jgi:hypothetical protein